MSWAEIGVILWARFVRQGEENRREWELAQREIAGDRVLREGESGEELTMRQLATLLDRDRGDWWDPVGGSWVPNMVLEERVAQAEEGEERPVWIDGWEDEDIESWVREYWSVEAERMRRSGASWREVGEMVVKQYEERGELGLLVRKQ